MMLSRDLIGVCPICQSTQFGPGFNGRVLPGGGLPLCLKCKGAERHRIIRLMYMALRPLLKDLRCLQFAPEGTMRPEWFASYDYSIYGLHNSLDMTATGLPDGSYDLVLSNHVIEHVHDDGLALRESLRVVGPEGLVHVNAPSPSFTYKSVDWGFADPKINEHYRDYGCDMGLVLASKMPGAVGVAVFGIDPVTLTSDTVYFFSRSATRIEALVRQFQRAGFPCVALTPL
jgi:SAM-dependent methyltransferase